MSTWICMWLKVCMQMQMQMQLQTWTDKSIEVRTIIQSWIWVSICF